MILKKTILQIMFLILGIFLAVYGITLQINHFKYVKAASTTDAIITQIHTYRSIDDFDTLNTDVYVSYTADNIEYNEKLGEYYYGMNEGQPIQIYYNPQNPSDCRSTHIFFSGFLLIGVALFCIGFVFAISKAFPR